MNISDFFKKNWMHFVVLGVMVIITMAYFSPDFDGYALKQHDVEMHKGMSNEIEYFREQTGQEPLWTNSMFGGMPAIQISTLYNGNIFQKAIIGFVRFWGVPAGIFLLHLIGFYILAMCLRIKPIIALFGALAFGFASYEIVILQAGHNSKAIAVALMAPVLGAFIMAYKRHWKWGAILSALFMTFQLAANHLQVTYYFGILLFFLGAFYLVQAIREKKIKEFSFATGGILAGYLIALLINYGNITLTNDYAKYSIRGTNDVTLNADGSENLKPTSGLDLDYITNWSYGVGESFTLISPYVKGSHSAGVGSTEFAEDMDLADLKKVQAAPVPLYWGDQPMTSGPVYLGIVSVILALLGLVLLKDKARFVFLGVAILALMLSWGKNFMGLTEFFVNNIPGYAKFRTVTIILVLLELITPLLAVLMLQRLVEKREEIVAQKKKMMMTSGAILVVLFLLTFSGLGDNYATPSDQTRIEQSLGNYYNQIMQLDPKVAIEQYGIDQNNPQQIQQIMEGQRTSMEDGYMALKQERANIYQSSMLRSIGFAILTIGLVALFFFTQIPSIAIVGGLVVVLLLDLVNVDTNYLSKKEDDRGKYVYWTPEGETMYPMVATGADATIMSYEITENPSLQAIIDKAANQGKAKADELGLESTIRRRLIDSYKFQALNMNTDYRVMEYDGFWQSSRASYFHKSLGGYHGAKLRNIQNLFDFHIANNNNKVLDMLNVKYIIQGPNVRPNPFALGNAWLVKELQVEETANDELLALGGQFEVKNLGQGQLIVNGEQKSEVTLHGIEDAIYVRTPGDTLNVPLTNGFRKGDETYFVQDVNGRTDLMLKSTVDNDSTPSFTKLLEISLKETFEPKEEAIVQKSIADKLSKKKFSGEGSVTLTSYAPNKLVYEANVVDDNQLVVFSEIYYPEGWSASIDGKPTDILKVDYLLRGLTVPKGKHKVEFNFDLPKLKMTNTMAVILTIILFLIIGYACWKIPFNTEVSEEKVEE